MTDPGASGANTTVYNPVITNNIVLGIDSISIYDGTSSVEEFLVSIDETALIADWSEQQKVAIARLKLKQKAKQFIDSEPNLKTTTCWNTLKDALKQQFTLPCVRGSAMKNFIECRQRLGEPCRQFLTRLKLLANKTVTLSGIAATDQPIVDKLEQDITTQFTLGLLMPIKQRVLSRNPTSLAKALELAEREESVENLLRPSNRECRNVNVSSPQNFQNQRNNEPGNHRNPNFQNYRSNTASGQQRENHNTGQRYRPPNNNQRNNSTCSRCKKTGHTAEFCRTRGLTCFGCKQPGHVIKYCPENTTSRDTFQQLCFSCQQPGHFARFCPARSTEQRNRDLNFSAASSQPRGVAANQARWD